MDRRSAILTLLALAPVPYFLILIACVEFWHGESQLAYLVSQPALAALFMVGALLIIAGLIAGIRNSRQKRRWTLLVIPLLVCPISSCMCICESLSAATLWVAGDEIKDFKDRQYCYVEFNFMQAQELGLARRMSNGLFASKLELLGKTNGDWPRSYLLIVRPDSPQSGFGQLYLASNGLVLGLRAENRCYFAYDTQQQKFIGRDDIEKLSPFLLLDRDTPLLKSDVDSITEAFSSSQPPEVGRPTLEGLQEGLSSQNPEVTKLAATLIELRAKQIANGHGPASRPY